MFVINTHIYVGVVCSFLLLWTNTQLLIYFTVDEHLGSFQFGTIANSAPVHILRVLWSFLMSIHWVEHYEIANIQPFSTY